MLTNKEAKEKRTMTKEENNREQMRLDPANPLNSSVTLASQVVLRVVDGCRDLQMIGWGSVGTCHRGARPSSYTFGYTKTKKITYRIFNFTCESSVPFSLEISLGWWMFQM